MTLDIGKIIYSASGIKTKPNSLSLERGLQKALDKRSDFLIRDTFEASAENIGFSYVNRPSYSIFSKPADKNNIMSMGSFRSTGLVDINKYFLMEAKANKNALGGYLETIHTINHELRHFVQGVLVVKDRGFEGFLSKFAWIPHEIRFMSPKFKMDVLNKHYSRGLYERAASELPALTEKDRKLVSDIMSYKNYNNRDKDGKISAEYLNDPAEKDANDFASKATNEIRQTIQAPSKVESLSDFVGRSFESLSNKVDKFLAA